ncbi:CDP-glycerol glycerophosphotransferase family protein [Mumia sp. DW29H23]|uniref:CDP-glycerol glycerophosphotransferase family protein n=1 Tax=Mumia sp. DW29H23 TaxID=3421241 RepID=UPI003D68ABA3
MRWVLERSRALSRGLRARRPSAPPPPPSAWAAALRSARWSPAGGLTVGGWAYVEGVDTATVPTAVRLLLVDAATGATVEAPTAGRRDPEVNHVAADPDHDYAAGAFEADLPVPDGAPGSDWDVRVELQVGERQWSGPLTGLFRRGTAGWIARRLLPGGAQVVPTWLPERGLVLRVVRRQVTARSASVDGDRWTLEATVTGRRPVEAHLVGAGGAVLGGEVLDAEKDEGAWRARLRFPLPTARSGDWEPHVSLAGGTRRPVHWSEQDGPPPSSAVTVVVTPSGKLRLTHPDDEVVVDDVAVDLEAQPGLHLRGRAPSHLHGFSLDLVGPRTDSAVQVQVVGGRFEVRVPLCAASDLWSSDPLPLPIGTYRSEATTPDGEVLHVRLAQEAVDRSCGRWTFGPELAVRPERGARGRLEVRLAPPRAPEEWSELGQRREDEAYRTRTYAPEDAVFFESFLGKRAACNPLAIRNELARRRPDLRRVWGVFESSVPVPPGDEKVVIGTRAWRDARGSARYVVTNDWLRRFEHRAFQTYVQTWHGTPLKRLALDRRPRGLDPDYRRLVREEAARWDVLVSQSAFMTGALRSAYGYDGPILEVGYPRNDILTAADAVDRARRVRRRLGLADDAPVVLYAPTWREDDERRTPRPPDPETLVARMGAMTLLVRGHAENIRKDRRIEGPHVLDVTLYPDVSELFLVADALVTDYSSLMFDFAVTGRPIVFFTPDLDDYGGDLRGFYFPLEEVAPGPVLRSSEDVADALADLPALREDYRAAYTAWQERFVPMDDGGATSRVVDAVWPDSIAS